MHTKHSPTYKKQSTFHIYEWSLNDLNGDLGICILITKMFVFLEIDQKLPNTCSLGLPYIFFVPVSIYFRLFPTWAFGSGWTCFLIHVTVLFNLLNTVCYTCYKRALSQRLLHGDGNMRSAKSQISLHDYVQSDQSLNNSDTMHLTIHTFVKFICLLAVEEAFSHVIRQRR